MVSQILLKYVWNLSTKNLVSLKKINDFIIISPRKGGLFTVNNIYHNQEFTNVYIIYSGVGNPKYSGVKSYCSYCGKNIDEDRRKIGG